MVRALGLAVTLLLVQPIVSAQAPDADQDSDRDGITDSVEQLLLEKFRPTLFVDPHDCAASPAQLFADKEQPTVMARNGTIYGQVFKNPTAGAIEIHYYALWDRDCGRNGHALDVEHVSTLLEAPATLPEEKTKAAFWYAGAHEDTICDTSTAAAAVTLGAETQGARIWVSSGKHAMFLTRQQCGRGCGGDDCSKNAEIASSASVINLGEWAAPMNGALWVASTAWPLSKKMISDFTPLTIAALNSAPPETIVKVVSKGGTTRAIVLGGDSSLDALASGAKHTGNALGTADTKASQSVDRATTAAGTSVGRAFKSAFRWVRREPAPQPAAKDVKEKPPGKS